MVNTRCVPGPLLRTFMFHCLQNDLTIEILFLYMFSD